jgi:hypothetical protein
MFNHFGPNIYGNTLLSNTFELSSYFKVADGNKLCNYCFVSPDLQILRKQIGMIKIFRMKDDSVEFEFVVTVVMNNSVL